MREAAITCFLGQAMRLHSASRGDLPTCAHKSGRSHITHAIRMCDMTRIDASIEQPRSDRPRYLAQRLGDIVGGI